MGEELKSLDFRFLVRELRSAILGGKFRKVYQYGPGNKSFLFELHVSTKGEFWLYADGERMLLTQHRPESPQAPPSFCMFLRKHLTGRTVKDVRQHGFDRIVEIITDSHVLVFEFVPPGNVILCDRFYNIVMPLSIKRWKDREILPKKPYRYPPEGMDPYKISPNTLGNALGKVSEKVSTFIAKLGFGPLYAGEICLTAGIHPEKASDKLSQQEISTLYKAMRDIGDLKPEPVSYEDGTVSPFPLRSKKEAVKGK